MKNNSTKVTNAIYTRKISRDGQPESGVPNTDRPALKRLMADIEAGKIDAVVVETAERFFGLADGGAA